MGLMVAELMYYYKGALTEKDILKMPMQKVIMYHEYIHYILNRESKEGQKQNKKYDAWDRMLNRRKY